MATTVSPDTQIVVRMPQDLRNKVQKMAADQERTLAAEVRMALRTHVQTAAAAG